MLVWQSAYALDLCKEKDTPTFRQSMEQTPELMSEVAQYLGDEVVSGLKLESLNLTKNIETISRGITALNTAKLTAIANGVAPAKADALVKSRIYALTAYSIDAQKKIGLRSSFLVKYGSTLKAVGGAAASWATFISAVDATCAFKSLYFSENHDPAYQLQKAAEFSESVLGGVVGIGAAAGTIPGPWSVILVETSITSKLINADLDVAADITEQESSNYQSLADRYLMLLNMPKILAGKTAQFPVDEKQKLLKAAQDIRKDIEVNRNYLNEIWAKIIIRSAPRNSILNGYATLSGFLEPARFSSLLDGAFSNTRKEVEQRRSRMLPTTLELPNSFNYPNPPTAVKVTAVQPASVLRVDVPAVFKVMGENLSESVPLTFGGCVDPRRIPINSQNMELRCIPKLSGMQDFGWKPNAGVKDPTKAGAFNVLPATIVPPLPTPGMKLVSETFPDNAVIPGGTTFSKSWTLQNTGSTIWNSAYCLRPVSGEVLGSGQTCVQGTVAPGNTYPFVVSMKAPPGKEAEGTYRQNWTLSAANAVIGQVWVQIKVPVGKGKGGAVKVVEPFAMPESVRVNSEVWQGTLNLSAAASKVQMQLTDAQGRSTALEWKPVSPTRLTLQHTFATEGQYRWRLDIQGTTGVDSRVGTVNVLPKVGGAAGSVSFTQKSLAVVGQPWRFDVSTSAPAAAVRLQFGNARLIELTKLSDTKFSYTQTFATVGQYAFNVRTSFLHSPLLVSDGLVQVELKTTPPSEPLNPVLTKTDTVQALAPWSARLRTAAPIYSADLVFRNGRRIPFDGGATQWETRDVNSKFSDAGLYEYELKLRRTAASVQETFPGGVLEVRPRAVPTITPTITSGLSTEQGRAYNLTVTTSTSSDKVTVVWPDVGTEQGLRSLNAERTQWEFGNRLFMQAQPQAFVVRSFKDGFTAPAGEARASLSVTVPSASMRLLEISRNIIKGESPYFSVEASLAIKRVSVRLGTEAPVDLVGSGPNGAVQHFRAQVPARQAGAAVPYVITAFNAQGQAAGNSLNGTVAVADVGDSLKGPNPMPAELLRGQSARWQFLTNKSPDEMWLEFSGVIGKQPLTGTYFNHTFTYPAGDYSYRLMRRDYLGNVFPIQGASGMLRIKEGQVTTQFVSATANGQAITQGATLRFRPSDLIELSVRLNQPIPRLAMLVSELNADRDFNSSDKIQWKTSLAGLPRGTYKTQLYVKDLNYQRLAIPAPVNFMIQIEDLVTGVKPQDASISSVISNSVTRPGTIPKNGTTDDTTPILSGTISAALTSGQKVNVYDGSRMFSEVAVLNGTSWTFTPITPLIAGVHSFTAEVAGFDGTPGSRSAAYAVNVLSTSVTSVSPSKIVRTVSGNFEIAGRDLPTSGLSVAVPRDAKASCQTPTNMTASSLKVTCQFYQLGTQILEIRTATKLIGTVSVAVKTNVTGVTWTSPSTTNSGTVKFGESVIYKVAGLNLLADPIMGFAVEKCGTSNTETGIPSNTLRTFTCYFNNQAGAVARQMLGVVKDSPGGQILLDAWTVPVEVSAANVLAQSWSLSFDQSSVASSGGIAYGSPLYIFDKDKNPAVSLAGGSKLRIPNRDEMTIGAGATFDVWVRTDSTVGWRTVIAKSHDRTGAALMMYGTSAGIDRAGWGSFDSSWSCTQKSEIINPIPAESWMRITGVVDPSDGYRVYINKKLSSSCSGIKPGISVMNSQDMYIGGFSDNWWPLTGAIKKMTIYKSALTEIQIQGLP